jgi:hypothetical protein
MASIALPLHAARARADNPLSQLVVALLTVATQVAVGVDCSASPMHPRARDLAKIAPFPSAIARAPATFTLPPSQHCSTLREPRRTDR